MVPGEGIEPSLCCQNWILSPARLPIPPPRQVESRVTAANRTLPGRDEAGIIAETAQRDKRSAGVRRARCPILGSPSFRFRLRPAARADRADARGFDAQREPPAACRRANARRSGLLGPAGAARSGRPAGLQRHARSCAHGCAAARRAAARSSCCSSASSRLTRRGCSSPPATPHARTAASCSKAARARSCWSATAGSFACVSTPTFRSTSISSATARCRCRRTSTRPRAAGRQRALPDRLCAPSGRGRGAHRGPAFRRGAARAAGRRGRRIGVRHAARRRRHVPAGGGRESARAPHAPRALHDSGGDSRAVDRCARARERSVIAVGTTACARSNRPRTGDRLRAGTAETDLFITPGYPFRVVDRLLTNFHLPKSTLLMLVSAFAGFDTIRAAYAHAIARTLPLLQLRRRHAARARTDSPAATIEHMQFEVIARCGAARRGTAHARPRHRRDAGLHAGRHLRHGQGDGADRARRRSARRSCSATPSTCGCAPGSR